MLKLKKGHKSKKKGKHREDELFSEAELAKYRAEKQLEKERREENGEGEDAPASDDWSKFQALTAGVDSILQKTQGDLERIKEESYFHKKREQEKLAAQNKELLKKVPAADQKPRPPRPTAPGRRWQDFEEVGAPEEAPKPAPTAPEELPDLVFQAFDDDLTLDEDLFNTGYIDVAPEEFGLHLAEIPDDDDTGADDALFDTSRVSALLGVKEATRPRRTLVSLGSAVQTLSQVAEKPVETRLESKPLRKGRYGVAFDFARAADPFEVYDFQLTDAESVVLYILDIVLEDTFLELGLSVREEEELLKQFAALAQDSIAKRTEVPVVAPARDETLDEFAALAQASLQKKVDVPVFTVFSDNCLEESEDPFNTSAYEHLLPGTQEDQALQVEVDDDPFSTELAELVLGEPKSKQPPVTSSTQEEESKPPVSTIGSLSEDTWLSFAQLNSTESEDSAHPKPVRPPIPQQPKKVEQAKKSEHPRKVVETAPRDRPRPKSKGSCEGDPPRGISVTDSEADPFDTGFVEQIVLKAPTIVPDYIDPFDTEHILDVVGHCRTPVPVDDYVDPFDTEHLTSIVGDHLVP